MSFETSQNVHSRLCLSLCLLLLGASIIHAATLGWDAVPGVSGYRLYYGKASKQYTTVTDVGLQTTARVTGLGPKETYWFSVTAYNTAGESAYSNEVEHTTAEAIAPDTTAPIVNLTSPAPGATVPRKSDVVMAAEASDNVGLSHVKLFVNGDWICERTSPPYSCTWSVPAAPQRMYHLQAIATDLAGNVGASAVISVVSDK